MMFGELRVEHLTHIRGNFYYLPNNMRNFFWLRHTGGSTYELEPVSFGDMLTELSPTVQRGNNFQAVAESLRLPSELVWDAIKLDQLLCDMIFK